MEQRSLRVLIIAVVCAGLAGLFGYRQSKTAGENDRLQAQVATLSQENAQLKSQLDQQAPAVWPRLHHPEAA